MIRALVSGVARVKRSPSLVLLAWVANLALALVVALPLAGTLQRDLAETESARGMLYGFDTSWWSHWSATQKGPARGFAPEIFGVGFAFRNLDVLLRGELPLGLFRAEAPPTDDAGTGRQAALPPLDGVLLGLGALYLTVQTFLLGGVLGVLRSEQGSFSLRGVLHGSGFYFGRLLRVALIALVVDGVLFQLSRPFASWADARAREAVSETQAVVWSVGHHALLLLSLLAVNMLSSLAKVVVVVEERSSALLAWVSAAGFAARHAIKSVGHYAAVVFLGVLLLAAWNFLDARWQAVGYKTQIVTLLLAQGLVLGRIALRFSLLAGQMDLYTRHDR